MTLNDTEQLATFHRCSMRVYSMLLRLAERESEHEAITFAIGRVKMWKVLGVNNPVTYGEMYALKLYLHERNVSYT
jgi:hypothetical protein